MTAEGSDEASPPDLFHRRFGTLPLDRVPVDRADAAVLILVRSRGERLEVLSEQRADREGDPWSGQVSLPGGRTDTKDQTLVDTALRELHEEVGITSTSLEGPPRMFDLRRARPSGIRVGTFVAAWSGGNPPPDGWDPQEVSSTFWLPLSSLDSIERQSRQTAFGEAEVETVVHDGHVVWGFTLRLLRDFRGWLQSPGSEDRLGPDGASDGRSRAL